MITLCIVGIVVGSIGTIVSVIIAVKDQGDHFIYPFIPIITSGILIASIVGVVIQHEEDSMIQDLRRQGFSNVIQIYYDNEFDSKAVQYVNNGSIYDCLIERDKKYGWVIADPTKCKKIQPPATPKDVEENYNKDDE